MKFTILLPLMFILFGCSYNYDMGVKEGASEADVTEITFSNRIKMGEIDDQEFQPKYSIWVDGSHTVRLVPGSHKFTFRYSSVGAHGGYYTRDFKTIYANLEAGKKYELSSEIKGSKIHFAVKDLSQAGSSVAETSDGAHVQQ